MKKAVIIGLGLIGGSLGLCWRRRGLVQEVMGVDVSPAIVERALELGAIDTGLTSLPGDLSDADLILLASPIEAILQTIPRLGQVLNHSRSSTIVTDVGSTKTAIVDAMCHHLSGVDCVGGHPMTGLERGGIEAADPYLFENAVYVLTPTERTTKGAIDRLEWLVRATGANPVILEPDVHDLFVAAVSHLPQLVAVSLVKTAADLDQETQGLLALAAGGFRDTTRIASSPPEIWTHICLTNKERILQVLERFQRVLSEIEGAVRGADGAGLGGYFEAARKVRESIPRRARGLFPAFHEIVVRAEDRPGMIAEIAGVLGSAEINIRDIEIMRVREGEGGTIRLGFATQTEAERGIDVLRAAGLYARLR